MTTKEQILAEVDRLRKISDAIHCPNPHGEKFASGIRAQIEEVAVNLTAIVADPPPAPGG